MKIDDVSVFLRSGCENFSEEKVRYYVGVAKSKFPQDSLQELSLKMTRGKIQPYYFVKGKKLELV